MDTEKISKGDSVRHKTKLLNGGMPMLVSKIQGNQALCNHFESPDGTHRESLFPFEELTKIIYGDAI